MTPLLNRRPSGSAVLLPVLYAILLGLGCFLSPSEGDKDPGPEPIDSGFSRTTPESLLTVFFEEAYNGQDSTEYDSMLDSHFEFENLPDDPDDPLSGVTVWDKPEELRIAGRMFSGWQNRNGVRVLDIDLNITFLGQTESTDFFQDQPDGETWYKCVTEVDLTVVTQDPTANDGSGIINRVVFSNQDFVVRPDPDDADLWVIRRQLDRPPIT